MLHEELIRICEDAIVQREQWRDRDTPETQHQVGVCWALLRAGCSYRVRAAPECWGDSCVTDDETIWLEITAPNFGTFDWGGSPETETFYLPTRSRLEERRGQDWY